jgi:hypothetical protein
VIDRPDHPPQAISLEGSRAEYPWFRLGGDLQQHIKLETRSRISRDHLRLERDLASGLALLVCADLSIDLIRSMELI